MTGWHSITVVKRLAFIVALAFHGQAAAQDRGGIIHNTDSPHVKLRSINIGDCRWTSGFWADKFRLCEEVMVPHMAALLKGDTGHAYNNFKIAAGLKEGKHQGMHWHDGDFYKWMEAATYVYAINKDPEILQELDDIIEVIGKAQEDDGYLSTQIQLSDIPRFSNRQYHELYNSGHLLTAACIHHRVTGQSNFLEIARKHADYLYKTFKSQPKELARFGFNQTQVMGLVELYRTTKNKEYLHLAEIFINMMPNLTAYNETCANICNAMFSYRMLGIHGESKYADIVELVLYNSALSGISVDGTLYIYSNPLRVVHDARDYSKLVTETPDRQPYLECFCCPPNLVRTIAKVSGWAYSLSDNGVAVNLYGGNRLDSHLRDGSEIQLKQETQYPWDGEVKITIESCKQPPFEMLLRIPDWAEGTRVLLNGKQAGVAAEPGTYVRIERRWQAGDVVALDMPLDIQLIEGHPRIEEVRNHVAIRRGPVVYCVESPDLPEGADVLDVYLPENSKLHAQYRPDLLGGLATISGNVLLRKDDSEGMYRTLGKPAWETVQTTFVPYYAWSNRGQSDMTVWLPMVWEQVRANFEDEP